MNRSISARNCAENALSSVSLSGTLVAHFISATEGDSYFLLFAVCGAMLRSFLVFLWLGSFLFASISGMAIWMTKEECKKPLRIGELIMGSEAIFSALREIRVYRGGDLVENGSSYVPGEELLIVLHGTEDAGLQFVYEASNAVFIGGGCDGHRLANSKAAKLLLPSDQSSGALDVQIVAGWAAGYETVKITTAFVLTAALPPAVAEVQPHIKASESPLAQAKGDTPTKSNLRGQSASATSAGNGPSKADEPDTNLPQTLPADHKVKLKHSVPSAFARTHPKKITTLNSKIPIEPAAQEEAHEAKTQEPPVVIPPASLPALAQTKHATPPASPPAETTDMAPPAAAAAEEDTPNLKDVLESMKEVTDKVHDRAAHTPRVPAKSPSKRARFADSLHANRPRHVERKPVRLDVGDVKLAVEEDKPAAAVEKEEVKSADEAVKEHNAEYLPGAHLSATEKRLRRSQQGVAEIASLLSSVKFKSKNVMKEAGATEGDERPSSLSRAPMKTLFVMIFAGVLVFCAALVLIVMIMFLAGYKAELKGMFARLTRRKQGQDKE